MKRIELEHVTRIFVPDFVALDGITLAFNQGEIHTILGENGAGKSTLVHILSGLIEPSSGTIKIDGAKARFNSSSDAIAAGIAMVHQRPLLCDELTVLENVILGVPGALLGRKNRRKETARIALEWGITLDFSLTARNLDPQGRMYTALLAALFRDPSFLILDEPTAILDRNERIRFMETLCRAKDRGLGIIVITHKIEDAIRWSDRVSVLCHGKLAFTGARPVTEGQLASFFPVENASDFMASRTTIDGTDSIRSANLSVSDLSLRKPDRPTITDVTFLAEGGRITGIFGHPGNGIDVLEDLLSGMIRADSGTITIESVMPENTVVLDSSRITPARLRQAGAGIVPSNRTFRGSNPALSIVDILAPYLGGSRKDANKFAHDILKQEGIDATPDRLAGTLSGGQLQRLILARELAKNPRVLLLFEPEWGLDVGSTERLRVRLAEEAQKGMTVVVLTDSPDTMKQHSLYHRIYRLNEGRLA